MTVHISIVVSQHSKLLENTLLSVQENFVTIEEASKFRYDLDDWLKLRPNPGQSVIKQETDPASLLALELPLILGGRDPALFSPYYIDIEGDLARIEHRPYDWTRLELM